MIAVVVATRAGATATTAAADGHAAATANDAATTSPTSMFNLSDLERKIALQ